MTEIPEDIMKAANNCACVSAANYDRHVKDIARAIQAERNAERERIASHLFNRNGFMTATSSDGDHFVKIAFLNAQEMQDFHRALVELSQSRTVPAPPAAITEGGE